MLERIAARGRYPHPYPPQHLDKSALHHYLGRMNIIRRTLDIDADTDARLREMADERGQDVAAVLAEAVALLDSVVDIAGPDIAEDRRRLDAFKQTRAAVPLGDVKNWVASWGSADELPRPAPRKIG
jgi:predicted transcriptional regulator